MTVTFPLPATPVGCSGVPGAANVITNVASIELVEYALVAAAVARTTQLPAAENVSTLVEELMAQPVVPASVTA